MSVSAISGSGSATALAALRRTADAGETDGAARPSSARPSASDVKKAAGQFEAIIVRQLLQPAIEPIMSGGLGGAKAPGGDVYGYMLTDVLANALTQGRGMGLGGMLEKQLSPRGQPVADDANPAASPAT